MIRNNLFHLNLDRERYSRQRKESDALVLLVVLQGLGRGRAGCLGRCWRGGGGRRGRWLRRKRLWWTLDRMGEDRENGRDLAPLGGLMI